MEHVEMKKSSDSELQIYSLCSIIIFSINQDIFEKRLQSIFDHYMKVKNLRVIKWARVRAQTMQWALISHFLFYFFFAKIKFSQYATNLE